MYGQTIKRVWKITDRVNDLKSWTWNICWVTVSSASLHKWLKLNIERHLESQTGIPPGNVHILDMSRQIPAHPCWNNSHHLMFPCGDNLLVDVRRNVGDVGRRCDGWSMKRWEIWQSVVWPTEEEKLGKRKDPQNLKSYPSFRRHVSIASVI